MPIRYDQSNFTYGEISPKIYARTDIEQYYKAAKKLRNCIVIPEGGVQRRFGTRYADTLQIATASDYCNIEAISIEKSDYLLLWEEQSLKIYLENKLISQVNSIYKKEDVKNLRFTQVYDRLIISHKNFPQYQLVRRANNAVLITEVDIPNNYFISQALGANLDAVYPVRFETQGVIPSSNPQIYANRTYYIRVFLNTAFRIYQSSEDAVNDVNPYTPIDAGNNSYVIVLNNWVLEQIVFKNVPTFDFKRNYDNLTFQPAAKTGNTTLACSGNIFTNDYIGGVFKGNDGIAKITGINSASVARIRVIKDFKDLSNMLGNLSFLGEPAWSATRGYPKTCSYYQSRLFFGGTFTIPNGTWGSRVNEFYDFDDSERLDDSAISWYPSTGFSNQIVDFTSGNSLIVHTDSGSYSSQVLIDSPITPNNFSLNEQNKDGVADIPAAFVDNQIMYIDSSLGNVKVMQFDLNQSSYALNTISVFSSHLIVSPVDLESFANPKYAQGCFLFVANSDGTLAVLQTLSEEGVRAWSLGETANIRNDGTVDKGYFAKVASSGTRCWFVVQRVVNGVTRLMIEELDFTLHTDCSYRNDLLNSDVVNGLDYLEGCQVDIVADGFVLKRQTVNAGTIHFPNVVQSVIIGLSYESSFTTLPIGMIEGTPSNLYAPKHIRTLYINYYETIGGTIGNSLIVTTPMAKVKLDQKIIPKSGVFQYNPMSDWDGTTMGITIKQTQPLPMTIIGISYVLELT